jgi:hypothetical protein
MGAQGASTPKTAGRAPTVNGGPHYVSTAGGDHVDKKHLNVMANGNWGICFAFDPGAKNCCAWAVGGGPVPTGESTWQYLVDSGKAWGKRALTVTEVDREEVVAQQAAEGAAEAARRAAAAAQAARAGGIRIAGFVEDVYKDGAGLYLLDADAPVANGYPHYRSLTGKHLHVMATGNWGICSAFEPARVDGARAAILPRHARVFFSVLHPFIT